MGLLDLVRPDPKCRHGNVRGYCSTCNGHTRESIPTGWYRNGRKVEPKSGRGRRR